MATDAELLLDAITQFPDNDQPRLEYADALDYDGYSPRAELIRLQIELAAVMNCRCRKSICIACTTWKQQLDRESELLREYAAKFRSGPQCETCDIGRSDKPQDDYCNVCDSTGYLGGLMRKGYPTSFDAWDHKVDFHRGFPRVHCRLEECVSPNYRSDKPERYKPTDWLLSVVRHHRGVEVWATDRVPQDYHNNPSLGNPRLYGWWKGQDGPPSQMLPEPIWEIVSRSADEVNGNWADFYSKEKAQVALARVIPAWARG